MKRQILILGLVSGVLIALLRYTEYRYLVLSHSIQIYSALIAAAFAALGIWLGTKLIRPKVVLKEVHIPAPPTPQPPFAPDQQRREALAITPRELEILTLVAEGLSNREIATRLYVSENTVKTHCSRAFDKLGARRRTQAVQLSKEFGLIP
jgi:NarL family two-component system response regulator LiaR